MGHVHGVARAPRVLTARGESLAAFDGRCIPGGCVAPPSNTPGILGRRALPAGRLARLGATPDFHHGLLSAAAASLSLSILFVAVYGATAWLTSLRGDVGTWSFEWERSLPLVPWLIVPYMSLDLFFVAAPFLCADPAELRAFRRRMTAAILVAGAVFLAMPLQFAFPGRNPPAGPGRSSACCTASTVPTTCFRRSTLPSG